MVQSAAFADVDVGGYAGADGDGVPVACKATAGLHRSARPCPRIDCRARGAANRLDRLLEWRMCEENEVRNDYYAERWSQLWTPIISK